MPAMESSPMKGTRYEIYKRTEKAAARLLIEETEIVLGVDYVGKKVRKVLDENGVPKITPAQHLLPLVYSMKTQWKLCNLSTIEKIIDKYDQVIRLRTEHAEHKKGGFERRQEADPRASGHIHYVGLLQKLNSILLIIKNRLAKLPPAQTLFVGSITIAGWDMHSQISAIGQRPLEDFELTWDDYDAAEELEFAVWCLLKDIEELREHIQAVWRLYKNRQISLIAASLVTTEAIEIVKQWVADFWQEEFGDDVPNDHSMLIKVLLKFEISMTPEKVLFKIQNEGVQESLDELLMYTEWFPLAMIMYHYGATNPSADEARMRRHFKLIEEKRTAETDLIFFYIKDAVSLPGLGLRQTSFPNDSLCTDTRTCLETQVVPTSLLFQLDIWVSIMDILQNSGDIDRPVVELREMTNLYLRSAREYIHNCSSSVFYDQVVISQFKRQTEALVETIQAQTHGPVPPDDHLSALQTFAYNPWAMGTTLQDVIMQLHYHAARLINKSGYLSSMIQLHNAFRDQLPKWPLMKELLRIGGKHIFGDREKHVRKGKFTLGFLVSGNGESLLSRLVSRASFHGHNDTVFHRKQQDPIVYLSFIRTQAEREISSTGLGMDLFRVEILAHDIIRYWHSKSWNYFLDAFGPDFRATPLLVGHFFEVLETPVASCRRTMHESTPTMMRNNAVLVMEVARLLEKESTHRVVRNYLNPKFKY